MSDDKGLPNFRRSHLFQKRSLLSKKGVTSFVLLNTESEIISFQGILSLSIDGRFVPRGDIVFMDKQRQPLKAANISPSQNLVLKPNEPYQVLLRNMPLEPGNHNVRLEVDGGALGKLLIDVNDVMA